MKRPCSIVALAASALVLGSCLSSETYHDLYVDPHGGVIWTVTEKDVRSTAESADERAREERNWLDAVLLHEHPTARAFRSLGARRVSARVVRDERPYTVVTEGGFDGLDEALGRLFEGLGLAHEIDLTWSADGTVRLDLAIRASEDSLASAESEREEELLPLVGDWRIVLTSGTFVEAEGFALEHGDTVARMAELEPPEGVARYWLVWKRDDS